MCQYCYELADGEERDVRGNVGLSLIEFMIPFGYQCGFEYSVHIERGSDYWPNLVTKAGTCDGYEGEVITCDENTLYHVTVPIRYCPMCGRELTSKECFEEGLKTNNLKELES